MSLRTELEPTHFAYRVYDKDPDRYIASCQIHKYGDKGIVYGMNGKKLLKSLIADLVSGSLKNEGLLTLEGYVIKPVAEAIEHICNLPEYFDKVVLRYFEECIDNGRYFVWVSVRRLDE